MEETTKKDGRGGKRPGAGRPKGKHKEYDTLTIFLPKGKKEKLKAIADMYGLSMSKLIVRYIDSKSHYEESKK